MNFSEERLDYKTIGELTPLFLMSGDEVYNSIGNMLAEKLSANNFDFEFLLEKQRKGMYNLYTLRHNGKLVGYHSSFNGYHYQAKNLFVCNISSVYIQKEYRKNNMSKKLMDFAEERIKKKGAKAIFFGCSPALHTDRLLRRYGYEQKEVIMVKRLDR